MKEEKRIVVFENLEKKSKYKQRTIHWGEK